ncbi:MAG: hypothetical protein QGF59_19895 [Pirellulaceae bacterium]|nr:hypothetical protein [Planctomycetaceae bacterium]MDP6556375.1 hypothetical protein [Pirellulaceae bacterium]MDP6720939.1 hypothetical protein [Pirellulaceae bacterium]
MDDDVPYLLLTPGPLTTSRTVRQAMVSDYSTWEARRRVGTRRILRGPPLIGIGSGAITLAIRIAPTKGPQAWPIVKYKSIPRPPRIKG